jgi:hypothetical protein
MQPNQKVSIYIDGFNFYYGLKSKNWRKYYWLDIAFMLHIERKYTREQRIQFFHTYFDKGKDLYWYMTNQKIELIESKKGLIQSETPDASNTLDGTK